MAAGLLMAQQIAGKAARDSLFLLHYGPNRLPGMIAAAAGFAVVFSLLNGRLMRRPAPRLIIPWGLGVSGVLQISEWWLLGISAGTGSHRPRRVRRRQIRSSMYDRACCWGATSAHYTRTGRYRHRLANNWDS